ncbi:MAG: hypothetical protein QOF89_5417 [Acidobacteriota bacterium]|nr:hypothetical protein [Acidobacteriota bacterium]
MSRIVLVSSALLVLLAGVFPSRVAAATLVADVNPKESQRFEPAVVGPIVPVGDKVLFVAQEPGSGRGLWVSDGTPLGTKRVPGFCSVSFQCSVDRFVGTAGTGQVVFHGSQFGMWSSDGTRQGTFPLSADPSRPLGLCLGPFENPAFVGGVIFVSASQPQGGPCKLWRTDGTQAGTREVGGASPRQLTAAGQQVFFVSSSQQGESLWVSDGTAAGTRQIQGLNSEPRLLSALGSKLLFTAPAGNRYELWVSDGTAPGTRQITHLGVFEFSGSAIEIGGIVYFAAGLNLWRSDGTEAGTRNMTVSGFAYPGLSSPVKLGDRLLFVASDGSTGRRLWTSRGTPETTAPIPCLGQCPRLDFDVRFTVVDHQAFFAATDDLHGSELWSTDGTGAGTHLAQDVCNGSCFGHPEGFKLAGKSLFFVAFEGGSKSIWKTDGAASGAVRLAPFFEGNLFDGDDFFVAQAGGRFFFNAGSSGGTPLQLWTSDGTPEGSEALTVLGEGDGSDPSSFAALGDRLLFAACTGFRESLWQSDGTEAGTAALVSGPSTGCSDFTAEHHDLTSADGLVFFRFNRALWRTDGTPAGTLQLVSEIPDDHPVVAYGNRIVFSMNGQDGLALWVSDGSVAGTRPLLEEPDRNLFPLAAFGSDLYVASFPRSGVLAKLLITDGTPGGTREVATLDVFSFRDLTRVGSKVYFISDVSLGGPAIFSTDGTAAGTGRVPITASEPAGLAALGGVLYFQAKTTGGSGLFRTDGTAAGTSLVRSFVSDAPLFAASLLLAAGNRLFFAANDGEHGIELWESDGTPAGTRMVQDVAPGGSSSSPTEMTVVGSRLFFAADDGVHGREPWVHPLNAGPSCQPSELALCLSGGRFRVEASWRDFQGHNGRGHAVALTADTGYFWFFGPSNVEVILKVLDGRSINDHQWVYYGALSNVEYTLTITDTQTGAARRYANPSGRLASVGDVQAFGPLGATGSGLTFGPQGVPAEPVIGESRTAAKASACVPGPARLCLSGGRFAVEARWRDFQGNTGSGTAVPLSGGDTGYFWFFSPTNVEVVLKVLDGRTLNDKFWVFYGALSNVEYTLTVTDTQTGAVKIYTNPSGRLASVADTSAF